MLNDLYCSIQIEGDIDKVPLGGALFRFAGTVPALHYLSQWIDQAMGCYTAESLMMPEELREAAKSEVEFSMLNKPQGMERVIWRIVLSGMGQFNFGIRAKRKHAPPTLDEATNAFEDGAPADEEYAGGVIPIIYILASYDTISIFRKNIERVIVTGDVGYYGKTVIGETVETSKWLARIEIAKDLAAEAEDSVTDMLKQLNISVED